MINASLLAILLGALLALTTACSRQVKPAQNVDACTLISNEEVGAIQGTTISANKGSSSAGAGMVVAQCVYGSNEPNKSVGIAVSQDAPGDPARQSPTAFWEKTFAPYRGKDREEERENENEKRKKESLRERRAEEGEDEVIPPVKVDGVGDEAFWAPSRVGGALYVLKRNRDAFIRISVGGPGTEQEKIDKSKKLGLKALGRL